MAPPAASNSKTWPPVGGPPDLDGDAFFQPIATNPKSHFFKPICLFVRPAKIRWPRSIQAASDGQTLTAQSGSSDPSGGPRNQRGSRRSANLGRTHSEPITHQSPLKFTSSSKLHFHGNEKSSSAHFDHNFRAARVQRSAPWRIFFRSSAA
ncbi:hypothetical protein ACLOJK_000154, partial [Asimina triloba]